MTFGNIYESSNGGSTYSSVVSNFVGTGIAYYSGSIFVSNTTGDIYRIDLTTLTQTKIATFDKTVEELTFDKYGNLYAIDVASGTQGSTIIELARVPEPSAMLLLGLGIIGLAGGEEKVSEVTKNISRVNCRKAESCGAAFFRFIRLKRTLFHEGP